MTPTIKTRNVVKDIKVLDKSVNLSRHMKDTFIRTKDKAEETQGAHQATPSEYASEKIQGTAHGAARDTAHHISSSPKKASENLTRAKEHFQEVNRNTPHERNRAAEHAQKAAHKAKTNAENLRKTADKAGKTARDANVVVKDAKQAFKETRQRGRLVSREVRQGVARPSYMNKGVSASKSAGDIAAIPHSSAKSGGRVVKTTKKNVGGTVRGAIKSAKKSVKSAKAGVKTAKRAAATAQIKAKAAARAAQTAERAARASAKGAARATKGAVKGAAKAVAAMTKGAIAAAQAAASAIASGGSVAVIVIIVICLSGLLVSSAYGILFSGEATTEDTMPLSSVQSRVQALYNTSVQKIEAANPHDAVIRHGEMPDFIEVLLVFAVLTTTRNDGMATDVVIIDEDRAQRIADVFWDMCKLTYEVVIHTSESVNDAGETVTVESRVLHIYTTPKSFEDMPDYYNFSRQQKELLYELMENRDLLMTVIGQYGWYTGGAASVNMTDAELYELAAYYGVTLPENLSIERKNVLAAAFAGVQINIPYHYDWRSYYRAYPGIEGNDFGSTVEKDYKGRDKKGLDCSGFVGWAYYSGGITWSGFGYGESGGAWSFLATPGMRSVSAMTQIAAENMKPGDIGFISNSASGTGDHTGLYLGTTASGTVLWLHCAGSTGAICSTSNFGVFYTVSGMDATFGERKVSGTIGQSDVELLAQLIFYEGRGYGSYCQELIAQVAVNRVKSSKFPNTLTEVLQQPGQYGYGRPDMTGDLIFNADITEHREFSDELWEKCMAAARRVADGTSRDENGGKWPGNVLFQHSFSDPEALGPLFKSYSAAGYTEYFCFG